MHGLKDSFEEMEESLGEISESIEAIDERVTALDNAEPAAASTASAGGQSSTKDFERLAAELEDLQEVVGSAKPLASLEDIDGLWDRVRELSKDVEKLQGA